MYSWHPAFREWDTGARPSSFYSGLPFQALGLGGCRASQTWQALWEEKNGFTQTQNTGQEREVSWGDRAVPTDRSQDP